MFIIYLYFVEEFNRTYSHFIPPTKIRSKEYKLTLWIINCLEYFKTIPIFFIDEYNLATQIAPHRLKLMHYNENWIASSSNNFQFNGRSDGHSFTPPAQMHLIARLDQLRVVDGLLACRWLYAKQMFGLTNVFQLVIVIVIVSLNIPISNHSDPTHLHSAGKHARKSIHNLRGLHFPHFWRSEIRSFTRFIVHFSSLIGI